MSARAVVALILARVLASASAAAQSAPPPGPSIEHQVVAKVGGSIGTAAIEQTVEQQIAPLRQCYAQGLRSDATLHGGLALRFFIAPSGAVSRLVVPGGTLRDRSVIRCVRGVFARLRFARARGDGSTVIYALDFAPHARFGR